jgi:hypothetical protein
MLEPATIILAILLAYTWTAFPGLQPYSLQLAAGLFLLSFRSKRLSGSRWNHVLPRPETWETALLVSAVAIGVGATGGISSPFLALFYVLLFLSALTLSVPANLVEMVGLVVFLWAVSSQPFSRDMWIRLIELPVLLPLLLFARMQFEEARREKARAMRDEHQMADQEQQMLLFLSTHLRPKLLQLRQMLLTSEQNRPVVAQQLGQLEKEVSDLGRDIDEVNNDQV